MQQAAFEGAKQNECLEDGRSPTGRPLCGLQNAALEMGDFFWNKNTLVPSYKNIYKYFGCYIVSEYE